MELAFDSEKVRAAPRDFANINFGPEVERSATNAEKEVDRHRGRSIDSSVLFA